MELMPCKSLNQMIVIIIIVFLGELETPPSPPTGVRKTIVIHMLVIFNMFMKSLL